MKSDHAIKIFSIFVLLLILAMGFFMKMYLDHDSKQLTEKIDFMQASIANGNWAAALKNSHKLKTDWEKSEKVWALFINHHEIDNISVSLKKSISYINSRNKSDATAHLQELQEYIDHIPAMESISFKNIL